MPVIGSPALAKLTFTVMFENLAIGIAGAAYVSWLSINRVESNTAAVQYRCCPAHAAGGDAGARRAEAR